MNAQPHEHSRRWNKAGSIVNMQATNLPENNYVI